MKFDPRYFKKLGAVGEAAVRVRLLDPRVVRYELRVTSHELRVTSYKL